MRVSRSLVLATLVLCAWLAACSQTDKPRPPEDPTAPTADELRSRELLRSQYEDVPVPQGFQYVTRGNRSFSYNQGGVRVGRFQYVGRTPVDEVADFYKRTMGLRAFDWQLVSEASDDPRSMSLDFRKGRQTCKVTVASQTGGNTVITIDVAGSA